MTTSRARSSSWGSEKFSARKRSPGRNDGSVPPANPLLIRKSKRWESRNGSRRARAMAAPTPVWRIFISRWRPPSSLRKSQLSLGSANVTAIIGRSFSADWRGRSPIDRFVRRGRPWGRGGSGCGGAERSEGLPELCLGGSRNQNEHFHAFVAGQILRTGAAGLGRGLDNRLGHRILLFPRHDQNNLFPAETGWGEGSSGRFFERAMHLLIDLFFLRLAHLGGRLVRPEDIEEAEGDVHGHEHGKGRGELASPRTGSGGGG